MSIQNETHEEDLYISLLNVLYNFVMKFFFSHVELQIQVFTCISSHIVFDDDFLFHFWFFSLFLFWIILYVANS